MKKRTLSFLLCAIILSTSFSGCSKEETPSSTDKTTEASVQEQVIDDPNSANLPDMDFGGKTFRILAYQDWDPAAAGATLIVTDEIVGEPLNDLVYERNLKIMQEYNIDYSWTVNNKAETVIEQSFNGGLDEYDMVATMFGLGAQTATKGIYRDLYTVPYMDLTKNYWNQKMQSELSVNGKYYQVCGDITFAEEESTMLTLYNKPMADSYGIENLYDLTRNGGWTIDKMQEYANIVIHDVDGNGSFEYQNDVFGFLYIDNSALHPYLASANARIITKDDKDCPIIVNDLSRAEGVFSKMQQLFGTTGMALNWGQIPNTVNTMVSMIGNHQVLFQNMITSFLRRNYRDVEADFWVLPMPKLDETQDKYYSVYNTAALMVGYVPITVQEIETVGVILEAMADASYDLTDTYINACLSGKYTRDQESFEMIELTMENIVLDMTFIFDFGQLGSTLTKAINNHTPFISTFESLKPVVVSEIDKFVNGGY